MAKREYIVRVKCGYEGCKENSFYTADTRAYENELYRKYGNGLWRCCRHTRPEIVLSAEKPKRVTEMVLTEKFSDAKYGPVRSIGLYWDGSGFKHGPGFQAYAGDFPKGTILRVTAEVILPPSNQQSI